MRTNQAAESSPAMQGRKKHTKLSHINSFRLFFGCQACGLSGQACIFPCRRGNVSTSCTTHGCNTSALLTAPQNELPHLPPSPTTSYHDWVAFWILIMSRYVSIFFLHMFLAWPVHKDCIWRFADRPNITTVHLPNETDAERYEMIWNGVVKGVGSITCLPCGTSSTSTIFGQKAWENESNENATN